MRGTGGARSLGGPGVLAQPGVDAWVISAAAGTLVGLTASWELGSVAAVGVLWHVELGRRFGLYGPRQAASAPPAAQQVVEAPMVAPVRFSELADEEQRIAIRMVNQGYTLADGIDVVVARRLALAARWQPDEVVELAKRQLGSEARAGFDRWAATCQVGDLAQHRTGAL